MAMDVPMTEAGGSTGPDLKLMRLKYAGVCEVCQRQLPAGATAWYDRARRKVRCQRCPGPLTGPIPALPVLSGTAGSSAAREYERRSQRHSRKVEAEIAADGAWREQVKRDHPLLGRAATAFTPKPKVGPEPLHVSAWKTGADGERKLGARLDHWAATTDGVVLHDRRIPRSRANIDHIVISSKGVWVIDAKEYKGMVSFTGGLLSKAELRVAGRRRTDLADGVRAQMGRIANVLDAAAAGRPRPPVHGVLCFVGAEWPLLARTFVINGVRVAWPTATVDLLTGKGQRNDRAELEHWAGALASAFPPA